MLSKDTIHDLTQRVLKLSSAEETEVIVSGGTHSLTRFANNTIHQNVSDENYAISVRTVLGKKTARATTNKFDEDSLRRTIDAALQLTRVQPEDPDLPSMPDQSVYPPAEGPSRWFQQTASLSPQDRAASVAQIVGIAQKFDMTTAGIVACSDAVEAIANSRGLFAYHPQTSAEISITMLAADSSGWQKANSPDVRNLDAGALAEVAARKARDSADPKELAPGKYTVILEPAAVLDLVGFMFWDWGGQSLLDERSFLNNRIGTRLFGENITIHDDVAHALQSGAPFDGEGVRRERVTLVENGVIQNLVYARGTAEKVRKSPLAEKLGTISPTGHGFPLPNEMGEMPLNIVFATPAEPKSVTEITEGTERGILVTRLWYIREVDPYEKILTGMTRDGTFYVEDGRIRHGIRNFRFNQSLIHMLSNVVEMGAPVRSSGEESFDMVVPAMRVKDFNFTEVTRF
jgi:predicted Zn-dependent protease